MSKKVPHYYSLGHTVIPTSPQIATKSNNNNYKVLKSVIQSGDILYRSTLLPNSRETHVTLPSYVQSILQSSINYVDSVSGYKENKELKSKEKLHKDKERNVKSQQKEVVQQSVCF